MTPRRTLATLREWLFRTAAIRDARAALQDANGARGQAVLQARLLVEVARRVAEPIEHLPGGSRPALLVDLYRQAVAWALLAGRADAGQVPPPDPVRLWAEAPPERLLAVAKDAADVAAVKAALVDAAPHAGLDVPQENADRVRRFAEALVLQVDTPRRHFVRTFRQRSIRLALAGVALIMLAVGSYAIWRGPNLVDGRPFRISSSWAGCSNDWACRLLMFCTNPENNPWIEFDLGAPRSVRHIEIKNRPDCCQERAFPLVVEVGTDQEHWTEVARQEATVKKWAADFPKRTARYVRLRVPRDTVFHLAAVDVR